MIDGMEEASKLAIEKGQMAREKRLICGACANLQPSSKSRINY